MRVVTLFTRRDRVLAALLIGATLIAYSPAWNGTPLWDDDAHMTKPELRSPAGLARIWLQPGATQQYYPVVHSVFWLEHRLWGDSTAGYHLVNILLHASGALLLVGILRRLRIRRAWLAGFIFALHPVEAESVAWISELKNVLSGVFFLAAASSWLRFDEERRVKYYAAAAALFVLGLLSKSAIAPFGVALLAICWWRRGRIGVKRDFLPLLPFLCAGIAAGLFTSFMESRFIIGRDAGEFNVSFIERGLIAGHAFWFYLGKLYLPVNLSFMYPRWNVSAAAPEQYLYPAAALLLGITLWAIRRKWRTPFAIYIYYAALLFPALGFFNVFPFRYSFVADHFQYLAGIGPIVFATAGAGMLYNRMKKNRWISGVFIAVPVLLGIGTFEQSGMYGDIETLYRTTIKRNPDCWMAYSNLGIMLTDRGANDEALECFRKALQINPHCAEALTGLGDLALKTGHGEESVAYYKEAISSRPGYTTAYHNLGAAVEKFGNPADAIPLFRKALEIDSTDAAMHYRLGSALMETGRMDEAETQFGLSSRYNPSDGQSYDALGVVLIQTGRSEDAIACFKKAIELDSTDELAYCNFGHAMLKTGQPELAAGFFRKAVQLNPGDVQAAHGLNEAVAQKR
jgi:tetratricopeptide (TPR) repeat protein